MLPLLAAGASLLGGLGGGGSSAPENTSSSNTITGGTYNFGPRPNANADAAKLLLPVALVVVGAVAFVLITRRPR